ncbi:MAG: DUF547 domain-containing protein, partial [Proteobacteria bacterium]|nr:DUF547 domain-containing protein [Pseudomonadota bacterium]
MTTPRLTLILATLLGLAPAALAAPQPELWERWSGHDAESTRTVDHAAWGAWLKRYVRPDAAGIHRVDYAGVQSEDRERLRSYLAVLAATPVTQLARDEQRAFWINLYNALTVQVVLDHLPVESIRDIDISPGLFSDGPWGKALVQVEGTPVSLDDIEHRILRPIWRDPRIHYAVNCASLGCPNLQTEAFTAANAEALLDQAARQYVNHPRGARVTSDGLVVSSIYSWFQVDF